MDLDWVLTFVAVVDHGGFTAAARVIHRSQSRVSAHVAALEADLGERLLDRDARPVALTEAGRVFLPHARAVVDGVRGARSAVTDLHGLQGGRVLLGSFPSAGAAFVPRVIARFARKHPLVDVQLLERTMLELDVLLTDGQADLVLRPSFPPPEVPALRSQPLWRERLRVVVLPGHPLALVEGPLALDAVADQRLVTMGRGVPDERTSYETHQLFLRAGFSPRVAYRTNQPQTLFSLVRAGLGVGVTNDLAVTVCDTSGLVVKSLADPLAVREVAVFWDGTAPLHPAARALLQAVVATPPPQVTEPYRRADVRA